jgi:hypothetical protein
MSELRNDYTHRVIIAPRSIYEAQVKPGYAQENRPRRLFRVARMDDVGYGFREQTIPQDLQVRPIPAHPEIIDRQVSTSPDCPESPR